MKKLLSVIRVILLVLVASFVVTVGYIYFKKGEIDFYMLAPIAGLLFFYFITKPKVA